MVFRSKFHSKTHSSYPQILRPPPLAAANRQPLAFNRLEAFVGCKVKTHANPEREKMLAMKAITAAAKKIYKKPFGSALSPQYMYVNTRGTTLIQSIHEMRKDLAGMKKSIKESMEKAKKAEEKAKKAGEKAKEGESRIVGLETKQVETEEWVATMQPLQETAIDIRKRFFAHYENLIGQPSAVGADTQCSQRGSPSVLGQDEDGRHFVVPSRLFVNLPDKLE